jgi:hypothetical protein
MIFLTIFNNITNFITSYYQRNKDNITYLLKKTWNYVGVPLLIYYIFTDIKILLSFITYSVIEYHTIITNKNYIIMHILNIMSYYIPIYKLIITKYILLYFIVEYVIIKLYDNRIYYINKVLDIYFTIKLYVKRINKKKIEEFHLNKVELYINLGSKIDITLYFECNHIDNINKELIERIYKNKCIHFEENDDIRLKIYYEYHNEKYIIYYPYKELNKKTIDINYYIPYPPFDNKIIENYRHDIIYPFYNENIKKKLFYSFFHAECKDILIVKINGEENNELKSYFDQIKSPFGDYGLLYNVSVKLRWILIENNIDINNFKEFYFKFLNSYLCEEEMDLKDHELIMTNNNLDNFFITERMTKILDEKYRLIQKNK